MSAPSGLGISASIEVCLINALLAHAEWHTSGCLTHIWYCGGHSWHYPSTLYSACCLPAELPDISKAARYHGCVLPACSMPIHPKIVAHPFCINGLHNNSMTAFLCTWGPCRLREQLCCPVPNAMIKRQRHVLCDWQRGHASVSAETLQAMWHLPALQHARQPPLSALAL